MPEMKGCGCRSDGLTRATTLWECRGCGAVQGARKRRCAACKRSKPAHPMGWGCCGVDWTGPRCGEGRQSPIPLHRPGCRSLACEGCWQPCGRAFAVEDRAALPHPEHVSLTEDVQRGSYVDRGGVLRCVGCQKQEPAPL